MSKRKVKAKASGRAHRRHNPSMAHHHRRRRRNPDFLGDSLRNHLVGVGAGAAGLLGDVMLPDLLAGALNMSDSGFFSYLLAAGVVVGPAWLLEKMGMKNAAKGWFIGSGAGFAWRLVSDFTGSSPVSLTSGGGMGAFQVPANVPLPGANVFAAYTRRSLPAMSAMPGASPSGASPMSISKGAQSKGMSYFLRA